MSSAFPSSPSRPDRRALCKYGAQCYQKNPMHLEKFRHPEADAVDAAAAAAAGDGGRDQVDAKGKAEEKKLESKSDDAPKENDDTEQPASKKAKLDNDENKKEEEEEDKENALSSSADAGDDADYLLPASPADVRENLKQKFLVPMPEDLFAFWSYCKERNPTCPEEALLPTAGLRLVGPFEVLSGKLRESKTRRRSDYLCHYRFYYDPPEFQTVLVDPETDVHLGYFRDSPQDERPALVACSRPGQGCQLQPLGDNLFGAVYNYLAGLIQSAKDPFRQTALQKLKESVHVYATLKVQDQDLSLEQKTQRMKTREKKTLAKLFHGAGMVVPYDKETQVGYREIPETTASLKRIFKNVVESSSESEEDKAMDVLHELITNVQFANDEGDPGMGLELALNAFCYGGQKLHKSVEHLAGVAYELLNRQQFAQILSAHLKRRRQGDVFRIQ